MTCAPLAVTIKEVLRNSWLLALHEEQLATSLAREAAGTSLACGKVLKGPSICEAVVFQ